MIAATTVPAVARGLADAPVIGVVRTDSAAVAREQADALLSGGLAVVEITFTTPEATTIAAELVAARGGEGPPWIGLGSVTGGERAEQAVAAGVDFIVSPNTSAAVAAVARDAGRFLILGALTPTEIVTAFELGADLVKVYPLPAVGGPRYLEVVRGPLPDVPMLAAGGFGVDEIGAYRTAGARAFGMPAPMLLANGGSGIARALAAAGAGGGGA